MSAAAPPVLRIGVLGAARIAPAALIRPAQRVAGVEVAAVAARDVGRAQRFAARHGIARVHTSYEALLEDPSIDALYNPLPNGLHGHWTIRALAAGKHVLCEKPLAANATEAARMADTARAHSRVLVEAFHWRYHALASRMIGIVRSGELGRIRRVEASVCFPLPLFGDIRYRLDLAGGAMMDAGCYAVSLVRHLAGAEPRVEAARAKLRAPGVDRFMQADLRFEETPPGAAAPGGPAAAPGGDEPCVRADGLARGFARASLFSARLLEVFARVEGDRGELRVLNPVLPQLFHVLRVRTPAGTRRERLAGEDTYTAQLRAFRGAVFEGVRLPTDAADGVANMRVIDAAYEAAGLGRREPSAVA